MSLVGSSYALLALTWVWGAYHIINIRNSPDFLGLQNLVLGSAGVLASSIAGLVIAFFIKNNNHQVRLIFSHFLSPPFLYGILVLYGIATANQN